MVVGTAVFGAPRFCIFLWKNALFSRVLAKNRGAPKQGRSYHHPSHPPLDALLNVVGGTFRSCPQSAQRLPSPDATHVGATSKKSASEPPELLSGCSRNPLCSAYGSSLSRNQENPGEKKAHKSGTKKEPKPKLFGPDIFGWGGGLPCEGVGVKKFDMSLETREIKPFLAGYPGILPGYPGSARKV